MAQVKLPASLTAANWDKHKSALAKAAKAPATKLPDELKELAKLNGAIDWDEFNADSYDSEGEIAAITGELDRAVGGAVKALLAQLQTVEKSATSFETEAKKDKAFPKEPLTAVAAIIKATKDHRDEVNASVEAAKKALKAKGDKLAAEQKKASAGGPAPKLVATAKSRLLSTIGLLVKPGGAPKPVRFMIVQGKKTTALALAYAVGPAQEKLLKGLLPGEAPYKVLKDPKAQVIWENKSLTFVSDKLSGTILKKIQLWLKKQFKLNLKMRVRKSDGQVEEGDAGEDISDDLLKQAASAGSGLTTAEVSKRRAEMADDIKKGLAGPAQAQIKALYASITELIKAGKADEADEALDEMEALLQGDAGGDDELDDSEGEDETPEADTEESPAPATKPAPGGDGREAFTRRLTALQPQIKAALAGPLADRVKQLAEGVTKLAKAERFGDAATMLDALEKLAQGGAAKGQSPAPTAAPKGEEADPAVAFNARLARLVPQAQALKTEGNAGAKEVGLKLSEAGAMARKKDFAGATRLLDDAQRLIEAAEDGSPLAEQDFRKQWPAVKAQWLDAVDTVNGQISRLQKALLKTGDAELIEIAEYGLNGVTGNFKTPLSAAIIDIDGASGAALKPAAVKARRLARAFQAYLASEDTVAVTDENEFGVEVTIRASLGGALRSIEKLTAQLR